MPLVRDEALDFAMGPGPRATLGARLAFRPLFREQLVVVARNGHPLSHARSLTELSDAEWVSVWGNSLIDGPLHRSFSEAGLRAPRLGLQCDSTNTMVGILGSTDMSGLMGKRMLAQLSDRHSLERIAATPALPSYTVGMFKRADSAFTSTAKAMANAVVAVARQLPMPRGR